MTSSLLDVSSLLAVNFNGGKRERGKENVLLKLPLDSYMLYSLQFASNCVLCTWSSCKTSSITITVIAFFVCFGFFASLAASSTRWETEKKKEVSHMIWQEVSFQYIGIFVYFFFSMIEYFMNYKTDILYEIPRFRNELTLKKSWDQNMLAHTVSVHFSIYIL